mmetsp:Transcript_41765/g.87210  ORF Transcript_41765/g.87210 Transcript_41765/m.87210 type:complete len:203 (-) Transcript_41765:855-1463(-)
MMITWQAKPTQYFVQHQAGNLEALDSAQTKHSILAMSFCYFLKLHLNVQHMFYSKSNIFISWIFIGATSPTSCTMCFPGSYSTTLGSPSIFTCQLCFAGSFSTLNGADGSVACSLCFAGTYSNITGASSSSNCSLCSAGTFTSSWGALVCVPCVPGTYMTNSGGRSASNCTQCRAGTYSSASGKFNHSLKFAKAFQKHIICS